MNKRAFYTGYMEKRALGGISRIVRGTHNVPAKKVVQESSMLRGILNRLPETASVGALVGFPLAGGYAAGRLSGNWSEPTREDLDLIQAEYVKSKMEQAIADLDKKKKIEELKQKHGVDRNTLRI